MGMLKKKNFFLPFSFLDPIFFSNPSGFPRFSRAPRNPNCPKKQNLKQHIPKNLQGLGKSWENQLGDPWKNEQKSNFFLLEFHFLGVFEKFPSPEIKSRFWRKNPQKCQVDFSGFEGVMENFGGKNPIFFFGVGNSWNWNEPNSNLINPLNFLIAPQKGDFSTQTISKSK